VTDGRVSYRYCWQRIRLNVGSFNHSGLLFDPDGVASYMLANHASGTLRVSKVRPKRGGRGRGKGRCHHVVVGVPRMSSAIVYASQPRARHA
jgi:hypothetical protein